MSIVVPAGAPDTCTRTVNGSPGRTHAGWSTNSTVVAPCAEVGAAWPAAAPAAPARLPARMTIARAGAAPRRSDDRRRPARLGGSVAP
jgi:hypothetical protein